MKKQLLSIIFIFSFLQQSFSQNPLVKQWDKRFGGTNDEWLGFFRQATDGGFILGGSTTSGVGGDKTQPTWGGVDQWFIKIDSLGNKIWDKDFGGTGHDHLCDARQTTDGGYILGGYSTSGISGDKTQPNWDSIYPITSDYWIVKTDSLGIKQWDKRFGGIKDDWLYTLQQTSDAGYILGGVSMSGATGDKTQTAWGNGDYWIVKTDSNGIKEWDKRFGGTEDDWLTSVIQTTDGGFLVSGFTHSDSSGDKTQHSWGSMDFWIVKTDSIGDIEWDKRYGGSGWDHLYAMQQTPDHGYLLAGTSTSDSSGDKSQPRWGGPDVWIIKIDSAGNKLWDRDFGGTVSEDRLGSVYQTDDKGYLFICSSFSNIGGDKTENNLGYEQSWVVKLDSFANKVWDKTLFTNGHDAYNFVIPLQNGCFIAANNTYSGVAGYVSQPSQGLSDYWIIKFCDTTAITSIITNSNSQVPFSIYPNPANEFVSINYHFIAGDEIRLTDVLGKLLFTTKITVPTLNFKLQTLNLSPGIYFLKAGNEVQKIIKQ